MAKEEPNIPIDKVTKELSKHMTNYKYIVISLSKEDMKKGEGQIFVNSNLENEDILEIIGGLAEQLKNKTTIDSYVQ